MSVSSVRIYINMALEYLDSPYRVDDVEPNLVQAEQRLANIDPADAAPFYEQIAEIRAKLDDMVKPADARQVSAAQGKIRQARDYIDTNRGQLNQKDKDYIEELFRMAVQFLDNITDERKADRLKAPVLDEIEQIRAQYGTVYRAPPPPPEPVAPPPPSQGFQSAKRAVFWAKDYFESPGRLDQVEPELAKADTLLEGDRSREADELRAEIAALREKMADMVSPQEEAAVRAAQREIASVRDWMDRQRGFLHKESNREFIEGQLQKVIDGSLSRIRHPAKADQLKAPILAEIDRIRSELDAVPGYTAPSYRQPPPTQPYSQSRSAPQPPPRPATDPSTLSYDDQDRINRARRTLNHARSNIESRWTDGVENLFFDATTILAPVSDAHKAPLVDEMEQLRRDLEAARIAEDTRSLTSELDRKLAGLEEDIDHPDRLRYSLAAYKDRFAREDVKRTLMPEVYADYERRLARILTVGHDRKKKEALERAEEALQALWERLAENPFKGLQQYEASKVDTELRNMRWPVEKELRQLQEGDADRERLEGELKKTDEKFEAYSNEWGMEETYRSMRAEWQILLNIISGWEDETPDPTAPPLEDPSMPQTRLAIRRTHYFLHEDSSLNATRAEHPNDSVIASIDREAQSVHDAAGSKMASAFYALIDAADAMETPISDSWMRDKAELLVGTARGTFENTAFYEPVMARVQGLDQRWKDELDAVKKSRGNLGEKLSREAREKWPAMVSKIRTVGSGFDPSTARPGDAVHLRGVYNRAGWDFAADTFGFSMRLNGVPIGGLYEDYVQQAIEYAMYHQKLKVDDHTDWDLVGVVLGWGKIKERTQRKIRRDYSSHEETIEEWVPVDCLRMKVIALRAGPVVVGPPS